MYRTVSGMDLGLLGQAVQTLPGINPAAILTTDTMGAAAGPGEAIAFGGLGLLYTGLVVTSTLFIYGIARSHPDKMVRTTGYIMTGLGVLGILGALGGTFAMSAVAASRN